MHRTAYILLLLTTLFWGGNAVAGKLAAGHISPLLLTALRWGVALAVLSVVGRSHLQADRTIVRAHLPYLLAMGSLGLTLFNVCLYTALNFTTAINASILQAAIPMVVFAINFLVFGIRATWAQLAGFVITVAGIVLIASRGSLDNLRAMNINLGDALMIIAVVSYGSYTVALRKMPKLHWQSMMVAMSTGAFVTAIAFAALEFAVGLGQWPDARAWTVVIYTAIFPSILAQTFYVVGNRLIGGNRAGLFINLVPVFGTLLSVLILAERFHAHHAIALALVFGGIWLAERFHRMSA